MRAFRFAVLAGTVIATESPSDDDKGQDNKANPEDLLKGFLEGKKGEEGAEGANQMADMMGKMFQGKDGENPLAGIMGALQGKEGEDGKNPLADMMGALGKEGEDGENPLAGIMGALQGKEGEDGENPLAGIMGALQGKEGEPSPFAGLLNQLLPPKKKEDGDEEETDDDGEEGDKQQMPDLGALMQNVLGGGENGKGGLGGMIQGLIEAIGQPPKDKDDDTPAEDEEVEFDFEEHVLKFVQDEDNLMMSVEDLKNLVEEHVDQKEDEEDLILGSDSLLEAINEAADGHDTVDIRDVFALLKEKIFDMLDEEFHTQEVLQEMVFGYLPMEEEPSQEQFDALFQALAHQEEE